MTAVEASDVQMVWGSTEVLAPTSFTVAAGSTVAVMGPNGAGKTTLLRILAGELTPAAGQVLVNGSEVNEHDVQFRNTLASLVGHFPTATHLTVAEHLALVGVSWGLSATEGQAKGTAVLDRLGLASILERFPHELSSGQAQVFALAATLTRPFEVLVLDEPEQRLDDDRVAALGEILLDVTAAGAAVVVACHDLRLVRALDANVVALTAPEPRAGTTGPEPDA